MAVAATVFVIDDEEPIRGMLTDLIASTKLPVETFPSAEQFLNVVDIGRPGCVVTDLRMSGMNGLQLQQQLAARGSLLPFVVLSGHGDIPAAVEALKAGAVDFIEKPFRPQQVLDAVYVALGRNEELRRRDRERAAAVACLAGLSAREREVLQLLVAGHPNKVVASRLKISHNTVENHRAAIMRKTGVEHLAELIRVATAAGLVAPDQG